jgi:RHS repeat-associated protein
VGWSLEGLSAITRCNKTVAEDGVASGPEFAASDALCLDGQRLSIVTTNGTIREYRTEVESFSRIHGYFTSSGSTLTGPDRLEVRTKDGRILIYGGTSDSKIDGLAGTAQTWAVSEIKDRAGNVMRVHYEEYQVQEGTRTREYFPTSITYGWHESEAEPSAPAKVVFNYGQRPDVLSGWKNGVEIAVEHVLNSVDVYMARGAFRRYRLTYEPKGQADGQGVVHGRNALTQVTECVQEPSFTSGFSGAACKKPIRFDYVLGGPVRKEAFAPPDLPFFPGGRWPIDYDHLSPMPLARYRLDLNGDGRDDFLFPFAHRAGIASTFAQDFNCQAFPGDDRTDLWSCFSEWFVVLSQPDGSYLAQETNIPLQRKLVQPEPPFYWDRFCDGAGVVVDLNNDGNDELLELGCHREGKAQTSYSVIKMEPGGLARVDLPAVSLGNVGSTGPANMEFPQLSGTPFAAAYALDVNGDGLKDILECHNNLEWRLYRNQGTGVLATTLGAGISVPIPALCRAYGALNFLHDVLDIDGDGREELVVRAQVSSPQAQQIVRIEPDNTVRSLPTNLFKLSDVRRSYVGALDVNGDGLIDFFHHGAGGLQVEVNQGNGSFERHWQPMPNLGYDAVRTQIALLGGGALPVDINGDGMQDLIVQGNPYWVWLRSTGTSFEVEQFPVAARIPGSTDLHRLESANPMLADVDGDGFNDIVAAMFSGSVTFTSWNQLRFSGPPQPELSAITDSLGARTEIDYGPLKNPALYVESTSCTFPQRCERRTARRVVSAVRFWDQPFDPVASTPPVRDYAFRYQDGRLDLPRQAWLGFWQQHVDEFVNISPIGRTLVAGNDIFSDNFTYDPLVKMYPFAHQTRQRDRAVVLEAGVVRLERTTNNFASRTGPSSPPTLFSYVQSSTMSVTEGTGPFDQRIIRSVATAVDEPDAFGNVKHRTETVGDDSGPIDTTTIDLSYAHEADSSLIAAWQVNLVSDTSETSEVFALTADPGGVKTRIARFSYFPNGLLRTHQRLGTAREEAITTLTRDGYGNVTSSETRDVNQTTRRTGITYDEVGFAPMTIVNGKGQGTDVVVDARFGSLTRIIDPNGLTTDRWYDNFGRMRKEVRPDNTTSEWSYPPTSNAALPLRVVRTDQGGETATLDHDVLGRAVRSVRTGVGGTVIQNQVYDPRGFVVLVERPHKDALTNPEAITFARDNLGRPFLVQRPDGGTTVRCYKVRAECETNALGATSCRVADAHGRIVRSVDPPFEPMACADGLDPALTLNGTTYTYGAFGDLRFVDDLGGARTSIETDAYGRSVSRQDPDTGWRTFAYNGLDELDDTTDASGNTLTFTRDPLGRVQSRVEQNGIAPQRTTRWFWDGDDVDAVGELIGTVTRVATPDGNVTTYHYDTAKGYLTSIDDELAGPSGGTFETAFTYDAVGRLQDLAYPTAPGHARVSLRHAYDAYGHLTELQDPTSTLAPQGYYWKLDPSASTDDYEQLQQELFGNNLTTTREYKPNGWVDSIVTRRDTTILQHLRYDVDFEGNILTRRDEAPGRDQWEAFGYDPLNRLTCSIAGSGAQPGQLDVCQLPGGILADHLYPHDTLSRLISRTEIGTYEYLANPRHAPSRITDGSTETVYTYDPSGNRQREATAGIAKQYRYSAFNKPQEIWREGASPDEKLDLIQLQYDAAQNRIHKETAQLTTLYIGRLYERRIPKDGSVAENVYSISNGQRIVAQITQFDAVPTDADAVRYLHDDHLGSTELVTGATGGIVEQRSYDAFGKQRSPNWLDSTPPSLDSPVRPGFTGHETDAELGLINMRGREYDPRIGQFLQPDPIVQAPHLSQSWNRYAYVFNNPLKLVDPSGYETALKEASTLSANEARLTTGDRIQARPGDMFTYSKDGNIYVNTGHGFTSMGKDRGVAEALSGIIRTRAESDKGIVFSAPNDAQKAGVASSVDLQRASADTPGHGSTGAAADEDNDGSGGGSSTTSSGPNSALQEALVAAAILNFEGPDAIRTDGTGSKGGIPGGLCVTCPGSSLAQGVYLAATVVPFLSGGLSALERKAAAEAVPAVEGVASNARLFELYKAELAAQEIQGARAVGSALKSDPFHRAASFAVGDIAGGGRVFTIGGRAGSGNLTQVLGGVNGTAGRFEWIVDAQGNLTHQLFVPGGAINGIPIVP